MEGRGGFRFGVARSDVGRCVYGRGDMVARMACGNCKGGEMYVMLLGVWRWIYELHTYETVATGDRFEVDRSSISDMRSS